jgi:type II secretory pathway pseudopilin PulG
MKLRRTKSGQEGYVLLALMLAVTLILIALSVEAPRIAQQIKREKEEELVHRGKDYATAIKRFVHKNGGRFPVSVEQLENTNHVRFLRKRYKDPMTGEDNWRLVRFGEAQVKIPTPNPGLNPNSGPTGSLSTSLPGTTVATGPNQPPINNAGGAGAPQGQQQGNSNTLGTLNTTGLGSGGQPVGGGQIIGVASVSKKQSIKEFNDKDHYNDWFFVYDLRLEQSGGTGVTVAEPRAGSGGGNANGQSGQGTQPAGTAAPTPQPNGTPAPTPSPVPN